MYLDLVLIKHEECDRLFLFKAPGFSHIEKGDEVICETKFGKQKAVAESVMTINTNIEDKAYQMILDAAGAKEPLKNKAVLLPVF